MSPDRWRLTHALLLSLLIHALLLSLIFDGQGGWLFGFVFPWQDRRIEAPDLRVVLVPAQVTATGPAATPVPAAERAVTPVARPSQQGSVEQPVGSGPAPTPSLSRAPSAEQTEATIASEASRSADAIPRADPSPGAATPPHTDAAASAAPAQTTSLGNQVGDTAPPPIPTPAVIAVARSDEPTWVVPVTPAMPSAVSGATPNASVPETAKTSQREAGDPTRLRTNQEPADRAVEPPKLGSSKQEEQRQAEQLAAARQDAARQEAARAETTRVEAAKIEVAKAEAAQVEATKIDAARVEAARVEAARVEAARVEAARVETARVEAARVEAARIEAAKVEASKLAAAPIDAAQTDAAKGEAARVEAARVEATRVEAARVEAARVEAARVEAARVEAARVEAARMETARAEAARVETARAEAARVEAARADAARVEAARIEAARVEAARADAARVEAARVAIGRQLDEEAARRDAATAATRRSPSSGPGRRYRLFGRSDPNEELILYAEAWSRKIQMNMTFDIVREAVKQRHADPLVTVAIRNDGSVESVTFVQSSGVAALDDAIRRVVQSQTPYQVFPPGLAREYDVIEIRRTWYFDVAIRLY